MLLVVGDVERKGDPGIAVEHHHPRQDLTVQYGRKLPYPLVAQQFPQFLQLLERVWGYEYLGDSRLVDAHVRRLRLKIEDHPDDPKLIVTARGVGYRLMAG